MSTTPINFEGRTIQSVEEARQLAVAALAGHLSGRPTDHSPYQAMIRAYRALEGTTWAQHFVDVMVDALQDLSQVSAAVHFFTEVADTQQGGALIERVRLARSGSHPLDNQDLYQALHAVGRRMRGGDQDAIMFGRMDIDQGQDPEPYIAALTQADSAWVMQRTPQLVKTHPNVALPILFNLQSVGIDPTALGVAIAQDAKHDPSFIDRLDSYIKNSDPIRKAMDP